MDYVALILSGGEGTRLKPLTLKIPKPAIPLVNKPFLFYQMDLIESAGIEKCFLLSGYKAEILKNTFKSKYKNLNIEIIEEKKPMGTGGAIGFAKSKINSGAIVFNGDVLFEVDLKEVIKEHKEREALGTIMAISVEDPSRYGVILMDEKGRIKEFLEKVKEPPSNWINAGLYILERKILEEIPDTPCSIERDVFPQLLKKGFHFHCFKYKGYWKDIGTIQSFKEATFDLIEGKVLRWKNEAREKRLLSMTDTVEIDEFSVIGLDCQLGKGVKIKKSIIFDGCKIGENSEIVHSIISFNLKIEKNRKIEGEVLIED
ncbi:MAG: NDP-sugar synthase [Thermoanaerobaculia bacterium]